MTCDLILSSIFCHQFEPPLSSSLPQRGERTNRERVLSPLSGEQSAIRIKMAVMEAGSRFSTGWRWVGRAGLWRLDSRYVSSELLRKVPPTAVSGQVGNDSWDFGEPQGDSSGTAVTSEWQNYLVATQRGLTGVSFVTSFGGAISDQNKNGGNGGWIPFFNGMEMGRERGIVEAGFPIRSGMTIGP